MKITTKLTLGMICGVLLVQTVSTAVRVSRELHLFREDIAAEEKVLGRMLAHAVQRAYEHGGEKEIRSLIRYASEEEDHVSIRLLWLDRPAALPPASELSPEQVDLLRQGRSLVVERKGKEAAILTYEPVRLGSQDLGVIEISDELSDERSYLWRSIRNAIIAGLLLVGLIAGISSLVGAVVVGRPMRRLVEQARRVGKGDITQRLGGYSGDELGILAQEMDRMCDNLALARERIERETSSRIAAIEQLRHADRLTTVGTMASGLAHELGTPINVVEGHAQLISENPEATTFIRKSTTVITRQCKRMTHIIRQLLDFSRQGRPWRASTSLNAVARETLEMLDPLVRKGGVVTSLHAPDGELVGRISADQFQQVLTNLVINAIQAMPEGGELDIQLRSSQRLPPRHASRLGSWTVVEVKDSGEGMDDDTKERIFEPFFTTKDVGEGTGLGLAVVFGLIKENGGWIDVQSAPGRGTCFTIYLPAEE